MIAGVVAGLAALFLSLVLRLALGVPLPVDFVSDRFLPFVPVGIFVPSLGVVGGPILAKMLAFYSSLLALPAIGLAAGRAYARLSRRRLAVPLVAGLLAWLAAVAVLWPALASNYHGLPPGHARLLSAASLLALVGIFVGVLVTARRDT
ncbi:MAG: hypothetical protein WKF65_01380 [Gaiellaceae bacterium]